MDITLIGIFLEGVLSFLSPCVLPLLPLYLSYLAGNNKYTDQNGKVKYNNLKVFITTIFFVLGICLTFVIIVLSIDKLKVFIDNYIDIVSIICGTILFIFSLHEIGIIHIDILDKEKKLKININLEKMNIIKAFLMGFVFSLGWSPCIGPMLSSAIVLAATQSSGYLYIVFYGLGLIIPFLLAGLLTTNVINFVNDHKNIVNYVLKIAGIIMLCFSIYMIYNASNNIVNKNKNAPIEDNILDFMDYEFVDQNGNKIKLSDYKNKYILLNFTTTWCTWCEQEREYFERFANDSLDAECFYVMSKTSSGVSEQELLKHINDSMHITTIIDNDDYLFNYFSVSSYPIKFIICPDGQIIYYPGAILSVEDFEKLINYCKNSKQ